MRLVLAFLQARMGSRRLPGKVLLRIQGKSILERAIERLRASGRIDQVVVVTTMLGEDDAIVQEALRLGAWIHRGSRHDVLRRFQDAAVRFRPDVIVRATADNPLIDIGSVNRIVRVLESGNLDYCMENELPVGAATEALTAQALAITDRRAEDPRHREHVTLFIKRHPAAFQVAFPMPPVPLRRPEVRITVDTPEDFIFVDELIRGCAEEGAPLPLEQYLARISHPVP